MPLPTPEQLLDKRIHDRFVKAMATYHLIEDDDKILVGLSGGKDSMCLTEILARRSRIHHPRFEVEALHLRMENIEYESDTQYLADFCHQLGVKLHVRTTHFDPSTDKRKSPCFLCSWYRRKEMFNLAQQLGFNKIALGHHQDDILHTTLLGLFYQGQFGGMPALLRMRKMPLTLIRPLCMVAESDLIQMAEMRGYQEQKKRCPYEHDSHRTDIKRLFAEIEAMNPEARSCVWRALTSAGKLMEE